MLRRGVEKDKYLTIEALEADFDLLVSNCYRFNGTESQISYSARELSDKFKKGILRIKTGAFLASSTFLPSFLPSFTSSSVLPLLSSSLLSLPSL